jgi:hypothetical protein
MPGGDGTGPMGMGPMTGRAAGFCAGYGVPGYMNPIPGRGFGMGYGRGRGFGGGGRGRRNWFYATGLPGWMRAGYGYPAGGGAAPVTGVPAYAAPYGAPSREQELQALQGQAEYLGDALEGIRKRIQELETEGEKKK